MAAFFFIENLYRERDAIDFQMMRPRRRMNYAYLLIMMLISVYAQMLETCMFFALRAARARRDALPQTPRPHYLRRAPSCRISEEARGASTIFLRQHFTDADRIALTLMHDLFYLGFASISAFSAKVRARIYCIFTFMPSRHAMILY